VTDSGRTVYGGGGITPDVKFADPKTSRFEDSLLQHYVFFNFARRYVVNHKVARNLEVDQALMQEFQKFLTEHKIPFTATDLKESDAWIRPRIKSEIFIDAFGQDEGTKVAAEADPEVLKALDLMPQAKALADTAKKVLAERAAAGNLPH
jgi:carboxyl-terminal processing protease